MPWPPSKIPAVNHKRGGGAVTTTLPLAARTASVVASGRSRYEPRNFSPTNYCRRPVCTLHNKLCVWCLGFCCRPRGGRLQTLLLSRPPSVVFKTRCPPWIELSGPFSSANGNRTDQSKWSNLSGGKR